MYFSDLMTKVINYKINENEFITESERQYLNDVLTIYTEKEEDHTWHMQRKERSGHKDSQNKKYKKDPEKADLYYKGKEATKQQKYSYGAKEIGIDNVKKLNEKINYVQKLGDKAQKGDDKAYKKYKVAQKAISNIVNGKNGGEEKDLEIVTSKKEKSVGRTSWDKDAFGDKLKLDPNKEYYHCSSVDGLTELKGILAPKSQRMTNRDIKLTRLYPNKRIYITEGEPNNSHGEHVYKLKKIPIHGYHLSHYGNGFMIETDEPIPVIQIK